VTVNNTLTSVIPTLYAHALKALRRNCVMPRLVTNDFSNEVSKKGQIIQIPLPSVLGVTDVVPAAFAPDPGNISPTTASIPLNNWKESAFALSQKELAQIVNGIVPVQMTSAVEAIADAINVSIMGLYAAVPNYTGTAGTTPFATTVLAATNAGLQLTTNLTPMAARRIVLNPTAYSTALALPQFNAFYSSNDPDVMTDGIIKRKFGFDWAQDQRVPNVTAGTITTGLTTTASTVQAVGVTSVTATTAAGTGACNLVIGDIVTFSGDSQTYCLTAAAVQATANSAVTLGIYPPKVVALAGGETITVLGSHVANLAFHREAFAFASRPLEDDTVGELLGLNSPEVTYMVPDPVSGITMKLCVRSEFKRTRWSFEALWGVGAVRPMLATRVLG